jgi:aspartate/tyrosine/aromatic aminotransferase
MHPWLTADDDDLSPTLLAPSKSNASDRFMPKSKVYIPVPTWANHHNIWADAHVPAAAYRYYAPATRGLDFTGMMEDIKVRHA